MPPWPARRGVGDFLNDPTLSQVEVELLSAWATGGTPLGGGAATKPAAAGPAARMPDVVIAMSGKHTVTGGSARFVLESGLARTVWVDRWELLPGNRSVVAQASVAIEGGPSLGSWLPGEIPGGIAAGYAWRVPAGSRLVLDIHYLKPTGPAGDLSAVALFFTRDARREVRHRILACGPTVLSEPLEVIAVRAHTARMGQNIEVSARTPDGAVEPLAWIPHARTDYQPTLRLRTPLRLPRGTRVTVTSPDPACSVDLFFARGSARVLTDLRSDQRES